VTAAIAGTPVDIDAGDPYIAESGADRLVVFIGVAEANTAARTLDSFTWGGAAFTLAAAVQVTSSAQYLYLVCGYIKEANIPAGSNATAATWSGTMNGPAPAGVMFTLTGVDQDSPVSTSQFAEAIADTSVTVNATSADRSVVLFAAGADNASIAWDSLPTGFTVDRQDNTTDFAVGVFSKAVATGGSESMKAGFSGPARDWGALAVVFSQTAVVEAGVDGGFGSKDGLSANPFAGLSTDRGL
jgi:hypothetical protein